jgi:mannose-6-phosphate isomerase-like protein (cupin superfamily)
VHRILVFLSGKSNSVKGTAALKLAQLTEVLMQRLVITLGVLVVIGSAATMAQAPGVGPDPVVPMFWSAAQMKALDDGAATRVSPQTNMAGVRLLSSASGIYRTGPSGSEIHEKEADFIFVREGEGSIVIGGKMIGGKVDRPNEIRGDSLEGGTRYPVAAGDTLYIPANMPHQFFVEKGKHWVITIVKITPKT